MRKVAATGAALLALAYAALFLSSNGVLVGSTLSEAKNGTFLHCKYWTGTGFFYSTFEETPIQYMPDSRYTSSYMKYGGDIAGYFYPRPACPRLVPFGFPEQ